MISITSDAAALLERHGLSADFIIGERTSVRPRHGFIDAIDLFVRWVADEPDALCGLRKADGTVWLGTLEELQAVLTIPSLHDRLRS